MYYGNPRVVHNALSRHVIEASSGSEPLTDCCSSVLPDFDGPPFLLFFSSLAPSRPVRSREALFWRGRILFGLSWGSISLLSAGGSRGGGGLRESGLVGRCSGGPGAIDPLACTMESGASEDDGRGREKGKRGLRRSEGGNSERGAVKRKNVLD